MALSWGEKGRSVAGLSLPSSRSRAAAAAGPTAKNFVIVCERFEIRPPARPPRAPLNRSIGKSWCLARDGAVGFARTAAWGARAAQAVVGSRLLGGRLRRRRQRRREGGGSPLAGHRDRGSSMRARGPGPGYLAAPCALRMPITPHTRLTSKEKQPSRVPHIRQQSSFAQQAHGRREKKREPRLAKEIRF